MTTVLWFSVVFFCFETFSRNVLNFISQKPNFRNFETYLSIEMSLNVVGQMTEVSNSTSKKSIYRKTYTEQFGKCTDFMNPVYLHTILHFLVVPGFFANTYCHCCHSNFVQLFNLVFHIASRARQTTRIVEMAPAFPFFLGKIERFNSFQV